MKIITTIRIEADDHCIGEIREGKFIPMAIEMSFEEMSICLNLMKKPELQPRDINDS